MKQSPINNPQNMNDHHCHQHRMPSSQPSTQPLHMLSS